MNQRVSGQCPACHGSSLMLGDTGHVTCMRLECPDPLLADKRLSGPFAGPVDTEQRLFDPEGMTNDQLARAHHLANWWLAKSKAEIAAMVPKAIRYGSSDLLLMGAAMQLLFPGLSDKVSGQELGVWFYVLGKVARLLGGYAQGELPDIDSWWDMKVYATMAQHIREFGGW